MPARATLVVAVITLAGATAEAQRLDSTPCSTVAIDATVENGFALGGGETLRELCSLSPIPATSGSFQCTWGNRYHLAEIGSNWTALQPQAAGIFSWEIRFPKGAFPGPSANPEPFVAEIPPVPAFPESEFVYSDLSRTFDDVFELFRDDYVLPARDRVYTCARLEQPAAGRFLAVDRTATTPLTDCFTRADGGLWEPCTNGDPALRALGLGVHVSPIAGLGSARQVAPPHLGDRVGAAFVYYTGAALPANPPPGDNTFRFRIVHDVTNPTAAHVHLGAPGQNGPPIVTFAEPASPIDEAGFLLLPAEVEALGDLRLYFDVHSAAHPEGELRGRLIPAQPPLFVDGFESGDTSAWSGSQP